MLNHLAITIEHAIVAYGAAGVFWGSILEEVIVPIPSSLVQAGAGFFLLSGMPVTVAPIIKLITWIAFPAALGVCVGSLPIYFLTYYGGMPFIRRFGKYMLVSPDTVESVRQDIVSRPRTWYLITSLRFIPLLPSAAVTAVAGLLCMPFWSYITSTFVGVFIRALYLGAIGWLTGRISDGTHQSVLGKGAVFIGVLIVLSLCGTIINTYVKKKRITKKNHAVS